MPDATCRHAGPAYRRIVIIGTTGTGKSHLGRQLRDRLGLSLVELDELYWLPGWAARDDADFLARVDAATAGSAWIVVGNYRRTWPITWRRADTIIWLDHGFVRSFGRLLAPCIRRVVSRESICNGNRESWGKVFCSRDSILLWFLRHYRSNRARFGAIFTAPGEWAGPHFLRSRSPRELNRLVETLGSS